MNIQKVKGFAQNKMTELYVKGQDKLTRFIREEKGEGGGINWTAVTIAGVVIIGLALAMFKDMLPGLGDNMEQKITNFG